MDEKPKTKALELAIASVQKEFGDGAMLAQVTDLGQG